jgi:hypothetical protein
MLSHLLMADGLSDALTSYVLKSSVPTDALMTSVS